jgi:prolyl oligopeptidase PreP (S9A serine peptidase family)
VSLAGFFKDNRYVIISKSESESDWQELLVKETATKKELSDRLKWLKFSGASRYGDGFFYAGYDKPEEGQAFTEANKFQKVFYHKLGDPQEKDTLIYEDTEYPLRNNNVSLTEDKILFYTYTFFTTPPTTYKYDIETGKSEIFHKTEVPINPEDYAAKQVFYTSKDGTRVPMFIIHKKGLKQNGNKPSTHQDRNPIRARFEQHHKTPGCHSRQICIHVLQHGS